ncbi:DUF2752 domain-containing protein [soil metagenome]
MRKSSTIERILAAAGIVVGTTAASAVAYFNPTTAGIFPQCPLHQMTGLNCPGCGLTRGFHALFNGDILGALHFNALIPVYIFLFSYIALTMVLIVFRGRGLSTNLFHPKLVYGFLILSLIFGVVRNFPFYPFTILAP